MEGKKRYVAIVLFLLIGLTLFTFANPVEEQKDSKGNGSNGSEVNDKDTTDGTLGTVEDQNQNQTPTQVLNQVADTSYADALAAVIRAEGSLEELDVEEARDLIEKVTNQNQKDELTERVDIVEEAIDAIKLVEELEKMVEKATERDDILESIDYRTDNEIIQVVDALRNEEVQESLQNRLQILSRILDDNTAPEYDGVENNEITNEDISLTYSDTDEETGTENEVTVKVTLNGEEIDYTDVFTEEGVYVVTLTDEAFNETTVTFTIDKTAAKKNAVNANVIGYKNEVSLQYATNGNTISAYISLNEELKYNPTFTFYANGKEIKVVEKADVVASISTNANYPYVYTATLKIDENLVAEDGIVTFKVDDIVDIAGNKTEDITEMSRKDKVITLDRTSNIVTFTSIKTSNNVVEGNTYYVKNGDTVTLRIGFREKLGTNAVVKIGGREAELKYVNYFEQPNHHEYTATLTIPENESELTEGKLSFTIKNVTDEVGNKGFYYQTNGKEVLETITKKVTTNGKEVVYDRTAAERVYSTVRVNKTEYNENGIRYYYVKNGDSFEFAISFTERLSETPVVTIAGRTVEMKLNEKVLANENKVLYEGTFKIDANEKELKQGTLEIKVSNVKDLAGNESTSKTVTDQTVTSNFRTVVYDCKNPVVAGVNNNYYYNKPITITAVDYIVHNVSPIAEATIDGEPYELGTEYAKEGTHLFIAYDRAGNRLGVNFTIDYTAPIYAMYEEKVRPRVPVTPVEKDGKLYISKNTEIQFDDNIRIAITSKNGYSTNRTELNPNTIQTSWLQYMNVEGEYVYEVTDAAGNKTNVTVVLDKTAPEVTPSYTETTVEGGKDLTFNNEPTFTVTDNSGHKVKQELLSEKVNMAKVGSYELVYRFTDIVGNYTDVTIKVNVIDTTLPVVTINGDAVVTIESGEEYVDLGATVTDNIDADKQISIEAPSYINLYQLAEDGKSTGNFVRRLAENEKIDTNLIGKYLIVYRTTDEAGNMSNKDLLPAKRWVIVNDTTAPTITVDVRKDKGITDIVASDVTKLSFEIYKEGKKVHSFNSGLTYKRFSIDWLGDGVYTVVAIDEAGNKTTVEATIDHTAPVPTNVEIKGITTTPGYAKVGDEVWVGLITNEEMATLPTITINGVVAEKVQEEKNSAGHKYYAKVIMTQEMAEGEIQFTIEGYKDAFDNEGVALSNKDINLGLDKIIFDKTAPALTAKEDTVGKDPYYSEISFSLSDNNSITYFELNGTKFDRDDAKYSDANYSNIKSALVAGENKIVLYDIAGNKTEKTFYMDWTSPTIKVKNWYGENPYRGADFSLSDNNVIDYFEVNGTKFDRTDAKYSDANYQNIKNALVDGENTIVLYDAAGNSTPYTFTLDRNAPTITVKDSSVGFNNIYSQLNLQLYDQNEISYAIINGEEVIRKGTWVDIDNGHAYTFKNGENTITAVDKAGNTTTKKVIVDTKINNQ